MLETKLTEVEAEVKKAQESKSVLEGKNKDLEEELQQEKEKAKAAAEKEPEEAVEPAA